MGFCEDTSFVVEGKPATLRRLRKLLERGREIPCEENEVHFNEVMVRAGLVRKEDIDLALDRVQPKCERTLPFDDDWKIYNSLGLFYGCAVFYDVQYHPSVNPEILRFRFYVRKNYFAVQCCGVLEKLFPDVRIFMSIFDELVFLGAAGGDIANVTNDREGKYFPLYEVEYDYGWMRVYDPYRKVWQKEKQRFARSVRGFQSRDDAEAFALTIEGEYRLWHIRELMESSR